MTHVKRRLLYARGPARPAGFAMATWLLFALGGELNASSAPDWRFGFEDSWGQIEAFLNAEQRGQLLATMTEVTASQRSGGDVNVNGLAGGWHGMQPNSSDPISFARADAVVQALQTHRFSMLWNLRINATWAKAGNATCYDTSSNSDCAPGPDFEDDLRRYIDAIVERYDGDGIRDMGFETPLDTSDDLTKPVRFYLMPGEVEFAGGTPPPQGGYGDAATNHFWSDSMDNLLRTHRLVYQALHAADPAGNTALISSGGVFWDL